MPFEPAATLVVQNPISGSWRSRRRAAAVEAALAELGFTTRRTAEAGDACVLARGAAEAGQSGVLVLGGDGTLYEAVRDLAPGFALGQYPTGTINLMAAALRVPGDPRGFLELVRARTTRPVRLGRANGRRFVSVGSAGLDAEAVRRVWRPLKRVASRASYAVSTLVSLSGYRHRRLRVRLDGREPERAACGVLFGRQPFFAQTRVPAFPAADPADGQLHVVLLLGEGRLDNLLQLGRVACGKLDRAPVVRAVVRRLVVESDPPAPVELDGDHFGWTPLEVTVEEIPTPFLAPPGPG